MNLRIEFYTVKDTVNGPCVTWRLRSNSERGPVIAKSTEKWLNFKTARQRTGELFRELFKDDFEVFDLTKKTKSK